MREEMVKIAGILIIIAGLSAILYGVFPLEAHSQVPDMGLIQVDDTGSYPARIPPILGFMGTFRFKADDRDHFRFL